MEACSPFCSLFSQINWLWYAISVIVAFATGALWFSLLFSKTWIRIFKIEMPERVKPANMVVTMLMQLLVTALLGLVFFILPTCLALFVLIAFCGWQKGNLKFRYSKWREFFTVAIVEVGYTFVVGIIFILFALI